MDACTQGDRHVKMKTEIRVILQLTKEHQRLEAKKEARGEAWKDSSFFPKETDFIDSLI